MQEQTILINNFSAHYRVAGQGRPLLILHGWGGSSDSWVRVQEILSRQGYRVIVPDLPGFGKTPPPPAPWGVEEYAGFVRKFMDQLGIQKFVLLGHSNGGRISAVFAATYPERVERLIFCAPAIIRHMGTQHKVFLAMSKIGGNIISLTPFVRYRDQIRKFFYSLIQRRDYLEANASMRQVMIKMLEKNLLEVLPKISAKTLIVWGEKDTLVPVEDAHVISDCIPDASVVILPNGHSLHREVPEKLSEVLIEFLKK